MGDKKRGKRQATHKSRLFRVRPRLSGNDAV